VPPAAGPPRGGRAHFWLPSLAAIAAFALAACEPPPSAPGPPPSADLGPAPAFEIDLLGGGRLSLDGLRGKVAVIDFWATWCAPCVEAVPILNRVAEAHAAEPGLVVVGIATDRAGAEAVEPWVREHGVRYAIGVGDEALALAFGAPGLPTTVVVAPDGTITERHVGSVAVAELERSIELARAYARAREAGSSR